MKQYTFKDRKIIRDYYLNNTKYDTYFFDFYSYMTIIEHNVWHDIRINRLPFYQQYPIWKYFVDFADPIKRIVIEADWKEYHKDIEKDNIRQKEIEDLWWKVYRVKWCASFTECDIDYELYDKEDYDSIEEFEKSYFDSLPKYQQEYISLINKLKLLYNIWYNEW